MVLKKQGVIVSMTQNQKIYFKRLVKFEYDHLYGDYIKKIFKIVEENGLFYVYRSDVNVSMFFGENSNIGGPFNSFNEANQWLKQELGNKYPSIINKILKLLISLLKIGAALYVFVILVKFLIGGFQGIGFKDPQVISSLTTLAFLILLFVFSSWRESKKRNTKNKA